MITKSNTHIQAYKKAMQLIMKNGKKWALEYTELFCEVLKKCPESVFWEEVKDHVVSFEIND